MTPTDAVGKAIEMFGTQAAFAAELGVKPPTVSQWLNGDRPVPPTRAIEIENITKGAVTRQILCPSFPWDSAYKKRKKAAA